MKLTPIVLTVVLAYFAYSLVGGVTLYQITTAIDGVRGLLNLPQKDIDNCIKAYEFFQDEHRANAAVRRDGDTDAETEHVRSYYTVINQVLAIADIEKMYIPPFLDSKQGLYANQILWEERVAKTLKVGNDSHILDIGCGRGRIAHHFSRLLGAKVSGFNIDSAQIENAIAYAKDTGMSDRLSFKQGDHHKRFDYPDNTFDGSYSFQAIWPFFKVHELDGVAKEMYRVMKPGAIFTCSEYLLAPAFDWSNEEHDRLHTLFLPTLAATQSNYPTDVTGALERAGFKVLLSAPSVAPAWPLTDQKTDLFLFMRKIVIFLTKIGISPIWVETLVNNLLLGGQAWAEAEKAKLADLNWQIIVQKPL